MEVTQKQITLFQDMIFSWWEKNKRDLPWRHTRDPYNILISEVMLQQTQVRRALTKYEEFIAAYPTVQSLASASTADVLRLWKGLGYNRRALYLKQCAQKVVEQFNGSFPRTEKELLTLPGLGIYTARAILVFAYAQEYAFVDTNINKIITHYFYHDQAQKPPEIQKTSDMLLPKGRAWDWHQALMDYGALELGSLLPKKKSKKKSVRFETTDRFFRGRIMDLLRNRSWKEEELIRKSIQSYGKDEKFYSKIITGLCSDGLISRSNDGIMSLPE